MIKYDKNYNLKEINQELLEYLGYDSFEEFVSTCRDFGSVLVKSDGCVYDFEKLNWLDFVIHSGKEKNNIVIKHKNEDEIKATISHVVQDGMIVLQVANDELHSYLSYFANEKTQYPKQNEYAYDQVIDFDNGEENTKKEIDESGFMQNDLLLDEPADNETNEQNKIDDINDIIDNELYGNSGESIIDELDIMEDYNSSS